MNNKFEKNMKHKEKYLIEFLSEFHNFNLLGDNPLSSSDILLFQNRYSKIMKAAKKGFGICLKVQDPLIFCSLMICLDGVADHVLILPASLSSELSLAFMGRLNIKCMATDISQDQFDQINVYHLNDQKESLYPQSIKRVKETSWIIPTSGTTDTPKLIPHTTASLTSSLKKDSHSGTGLQWGNLYEISSFAGIQVFLQSLIGGSSLILTKSFDLDARLRTLSAHDCNALSATPTMWRKILMLPVSRQFEFHQITLGGEIVDQAILDALKYRYPEARITHIFASTETGVGFAVSDGKAGFPSDFLSEDSKVSLKISDDGVLLVKPKVLSQHKLKINGQQEDGYVRTGDLVCEQQGRIFFLGRETGTVNVGGQKVHPEEVEQVLNDHQDVAFSRVEGKKSSIVGQLVIARIALKEGCDQSKDLSRSLKEHCQKHLPNYKIPVQFIVTKDFHCSSNGKLLRS